MFRVSNLTKFNKNGWTYLQCDFDVTDMSNPFREKKMWVAVKEDNSDMVTDEVYDAFVLVPLFCGMYYGQDVHIDGEISPRLYHNIQHYLQTIFNNFSDYTKKVNFTVKGTKKIKEAPGSIIGTGISCGVDSLVTIYDNLVKEDDPDYKINGLFLFNCGTHGDFENENSRKLWLKRSELNSKCAEALGLPMYLMDSNYHAFTHRIGEQKIGYLAIYSCILAFQKVVHRYLVSSNFSYDEVAQGNRLSRDFDISEYCESYMPHLISTERIELVTDGCQYNRAEKVERICDWEIAQRHLNVCHNPQDNACNCSRCEKCMNTLIPLEALGKQNYFTNVFDLNIYNKYSDKFKKKYVAHIGAEKQMEDSIVDFCREKGMTLPSRYNLYSLYLKTRWFVGRMLRKMGMMK